MREWQLSECFFLRVDGVGSIQYEESGLQTRTYFLTNFTLWGVCISAHLATHITFTFMSIPYTIFHFFMHAPPPSSPHPPPYPSPPLHTLNPSPPTQIPLHTIIKRLSPPYQNPSRNAETKKEAFEKNEHEIPKFPKSQSTKIPKKSSKKKRTTRNHAQKKKD
ncbi:hypothetical protein BDR22DRAFT_436677 [Usnea florida]